MKINEIIELVFQCKGKQRRKNQDMLFANKSTHTERNILIKMNELKSSFFRTSERNQNQSAFIRLNWNICQVRGKYALCKT